jgi:hypothetical protein
MKTSIIAILALLIAAPAWACDPVTPSCNSTASAASDSQSKSSAAAESESSAKQQQSQTLSPTLNAGSSTATSGPATSSSGGNVMKSYYGSRSNFTPINSPSVRIGEVSKPVPQVFTEYQRDQDPFSGDSYDAFVVGIGIPITWNTGVDKALATESQRLEDRNLHERERHQAEMAKVCMELHKYVMSTDIQLSPELWDRCKGFEHFNNAAGMKIMGPHWGEYSPNQMSPHHTKYHDR